MKRPYSKNTTAIIIILLIILFACKKNTTDNNTPPPPVIAFKKIYDIPINRESMYYSCFSQTRDNGFFVAGALRTDLYVDKSISFLIKTDGAANVIWAKTYSINGGVDCKAAIQTSDGGYMLVGNSKTPGSSAMIFLIKTNANGDIAWTKIIHAERDAIVHYPIYCTDVKQTNDNGFIVKGTGDMWDDHPFLLKTDAVGNIQWMKSYRISIALNPSGKSVITSADNGGVFVTSFGDDWILVKTKSNGDIDWNRRYASDFGFEVGSIGIQANDGGYVFTGSSAQDVVAGRLDATLIKTNANGNIMWWKEYGGDNANEYGYSIIQAADGGYVIGGARFDFSALSKSNVFIVKTNEQGDTTWTRMYDGGDPNRYTGIYFGNKLMLQLSQDNGYIFAAGAQVLDQSAQKRDRIYLAKADNKGHIGCNEYSDNVRVTSITSDNRSAVNFSIVDLNPRIFESSFTATSVLINTAKICPQ